MAVLVSKDWQPPRDHTMEGSASTTTTSTTSPPSSISRSRSSPVPAGDHAQPQSPNGQQQAQPYPLGAPQAGWTPSPTAQPFYPQFYQNPQQQFSMHGHPAQMQGQMPPGPYYDPAANAQFAQWAYHQMMYNAQQQAHMQQQYPGHPGSMNQMQGYGGPFPGPASPAGQGPSGFGSSQPQNGTRQGGVAGGPPGDYTGFHPYRRPNRQGSHAQDTSQPGTPVGGRQGSPVSHPGNTFQPPYVRTDATGSSSSVNSSSSNRQRTDSMKNVSQSGAQPGHAQSSGNGPSPGRIRTSSLQGRSASPPSKGVNSPVTTSSSGGPPKPHGRTASTSSTPSASSSPSSRPTAVAQAPAGNSSTSAGRPPKPSPLSQGTGTTPAEKRMSRDDSDLAAMKDPTSMRGAGLKGRLRRAFTALQEDESDPIAPLPTSKAKDGNAAAGATNGISRSNSTPGGLSSMSPAESDQGSLATGQTKKKRALFNTKFNRSTDNISISSVSSSASVMIRKLGSIGKLARRNSIAGITSLFKDKKEKEESEAKKDKKDKKKGKGEAAAASISHATAEVDRSSSDEWSADLNGLSPAARLARQHTLKSNAEAAAKAKAQQEAEAALAAQQQQQQLQQQQQQPQVPGPWEKNTTNRQHGVVAPRVGENGRFEEEDEDESEEGAYRGPTEYGAEAWDDDQSWGEIDVEEDITIRQDLGGVSLDDTEEGFEQGESEPWAQGIRRSVERRATPIKGILKNAEGYSQSVYLESSPALSNRARSNSYNPLPTTAEHQGPLSHLPPGDPDHIDGLHRHGSHSSGGHAPPTNSGPAPFLPSFTFESGTESPGDVSPTEPSGPPAAGKSLFNHPNSSAPTLSTMTAQAPSLTHRSATTPAKKLSFASNLSVYDTFPATAYDRRSEPATWSRLTPALAQRIKEELNSFKMEEMEVHTASRIHTQFFV